jgi:hypothetical protein
MLANGRVSSQFTQLLLSIQHGGVEKHQFVVALR